MSFVKKINGWKKMSSPWQLPLLMVVAMGITWSNAQASTIYQCKQADGKIVFQEIPCATSAVQSVITPAIRAVSPKTAPASTPQASLPQETGDAVCRQTGVSVFDPSRPQGLQHPQAAFNLCKKTLAAPMNRDGVCLETCVQAWVEEYKKTYLGKGQ